MNAPDIRRTIDAIWRIESPRLIAALTRLVRDVSLAQDMAQDALVAALSQWPSQGVPDNPGAWLMTTARHRAIDAIRRERRVSQKHDEILSQSDASIKPDIESVVDNYVSDDLLRLLFISCHPILSTEARVALTLRLLGGLTTDEIARAFLVPETTIAQRIVRAKKTLSQEQIPFELPPKEELIERLSSVLEVIYLIFNEGYSATAGDDLVRPSLCEDAMRLGRVLVGLTRAEPEVHGLVALMELQASRLRARVSATGDQILLLDQNRALWDRLLISRGLAALKIALNLGGRGPYVLQACIAACHARALTAQETDWAQIASLYGELSMLVPSPVIELNRAVAVSMAFGPEAGLALIEPLTEELASYHLLQSVRADLLLRMNRLKEAHDAFLLAAELTQNAREKNLLLARAAQCAESIKEK
jgi:RNA polymerase sigma-70 factor (ECF subfamily)